ncbi:MAG TPA: butyrate kinase [Bacteroidales bacterium]|nr:butyrate kinase [Bacteroidales bacterium]HSA43844.1 butyrate kinase [Bacteroidales bacterium]
MNTFNILVVNPKDRLTQIAVYDNHKLLYLINRKHSGDDLAEFRKITDQLEYRKKIIMNELQNNEFHFDKLRIVISRGGLIRPVQSGVFAVNEAMKKDLMDSPVGEDVINLGGLLADAIAADFPGVLALVADPTVVDEMQDVARVTGYPDVKRKSIFHALSQKAVAKQHAEMNTKKYEDLNLIVAHLGNGTTVGAHRKGRVVDVNQGFDGDGPFSNVRSGSLPMGEIIKLCFDRNMTREQVTCLVTHCGGLNAHLGTSNINEIDKKIEEGDHHFIMIIRAMAYQIAKSIGEMYAVLKTDVDAILITGDQAYSRHLTHFILEHVEKMAPVFIYPGDNDVQAMAANANRILKGEMKILDYEG